MTKLIKLFKKQGINFNQIQPSKKEFILKIIKEIRLLKKFLGLQFGRQKTKIVDKKNNCR